MIPDNEVVNNVRLSRCFFYISDILQQLIEKDEFNQVPVRKSKKIPFHISDEELMSFQYSDSAISLSEIVRRINELIDMDKMKKLTYKSVAAWLLDIDALVEKQSGDGRMKKFPTLTGEKLGITVSEQMGRYGLYQTVVYDRSAQQFILDNMDAILAYNREHNMKN